MNRYKIRIEWSNAIRNIYLYRNDYSVIFSVSDHNGFRNIVNHRHINIRNYFDNFKGKQQKKYEIRAGHIKINSTIKVILGKLDIGSYFMAKLSTLEYYTLYLYIKDNMMTSSNINEFFNEQRKDNTQS